MFSREFPRSFMLSWDLWDVFHPPWKSRALHISLGPWNTAFIFYHHHNKLWQPQQPKQLLSPVGWKAGWLAAGSSVASRRNSKLKGLLRTARNFWDDSGRLLQVHQWCWAALLHAAESTISEILHRVWGIPALLMSASIVHWCQAATASFTIWVPHIKVSRGAARLVHHG